MTSRIIHVDPHQAGKVCGILYFLFGFIVLPFFLISFVISDQAPIGIAFAIVIPFMYGVFGYIGTAIFSVLYNVISKWVGGIEISLSETTAPSSFS